MDSTAVAAWGEVAGAIAVVVSLLYLSAQVRQGNRVAKAAAQESLVNSFRNFQQPVASDPELYRIFDQGLNDLGSLEGLDRGRFFQLAFQWGKIFESAHYHWEEGLLDEGTWEGWRTSFAHYFHTPGWQRYWDLRSDCFSPAFRAFAEILPVPERRATASTLGEERRIEPGMPESAGADSSSSPTGPQSGN